MQLHYGSKCLIALFEEHPKLAQYLRTHKDEALIGAVWPFLHHQISPLVLYLCVYLSCQRLHQTSARSTQLIYAPKSWDTFSHQLMLTLGSSCHQPSLPECKD